MINNRRVKNTNKINCISFGYLQYDDSQLFKYNGIIKFQYLHIVGSDDVLPSIMMVFDDQIARTTLLIKCLMALLALPSSMANR